MNQQDAVHLLINAAKKAQKEGVFDLQEAYHVALAVHALNTPLPEVKDDIEANTQQGQTEKNVKDISVREAEIVNGNKEE